MKYFIVVFLIFAGIAVSEEFCDDRDGRCYGAIKLGNQIWMSKNMNYGTMMLPRARQRFGHKYCYNDLEMACDKFGGLYSFVNAQYICPGGWRLPSVEDWVTFQKMIEVETGNTDVGQSLKSTSGWEKTKMGNGTDDIGFSGVPAGYHSVDFGFMSLGKSTGFWTTNKLNDSLAYMVTLAPGVPFLWIDTEYRHDVAASVRCIKDS